jgi:hypothetical protein
MQDRFTDRKPEEAERGSDTGQEARGSYDAGTRIIGDTGGVPDKGGGRGETQEAGE